MTAGLSLLLALRLALADADAGTAPREVDEVRTGTIVTTGNVTMDVTGGGYMPAASLLATGQELAQLRAENAALKAAPPQPAPNVLLVVITAVVGLGLGIGLGVSLKH